MQDNNKYLISIIISTYNDKNLRDALQSLRNQTFKNFTIILINDGGNDLKEIINEFSDLNIKFINLIKNQGLSKCLNKGIREVNTKYIARMDSDDLCLPRRLELQIKYLEENNLDLIGTSIINKSKKDIYSSKIGHFINNKQIEKITLRYVPLAHPTFFGKTDLFKKILYDEKLRYSQDYDFIVRCIINRYKIGNLNIPLLIYNNEMSNNLNKIFLQIKISNEISRKYNSFKKKLESYKLDYNLINRKISLYEENCIGLRSKIFRLKNIYIRKLGYIIYFLVSCFSKELRIFNYRNIR